MVTAQERMRQGELRRYGISYAQSDDQQFVIERSVLVEWLAELTQPIGCLGNPGVHQG